ncbi:hypothetical protein KAFR_0C02460 [Kazachstania africana CBS 2517]|uniref:Calcineurin-like phosphoesterase domain-containing protein n=1 Tax=Kazachstania africana (strain ATCC 22294 / BCRC 22015 / CBS 2517 / CECT 1963 / NBRC 1671 / NRRL Y-8276) TaxID=1071382 RepID=H2AS89_KAZAF|nr:hypothetical protein KAFR_0C02460 [Kazachstania africana CBS 2517]CCF57239.1 hypothetical protein KAFR_0C02460 [Kazachstania africana CBS 2517]
MWKHTLRRVSIVATVLTIIANVYIFTYPSLHPARCSWHCSNNGTNDEVPATTFEKFVFYTNRYIKDVKLQWTSKERSDHDTNDIHILAYGDPQIKGIWSSTPYRTRLDIFGNDHYLGHIAGMMQKRLNPTHIAVLGDLFSSQWIPDFEFFNRAVRFAKRLYHRDTQWLKEIERKEHDEDGKYKVDWSKWGENFNGILNSETKDFGFGFKDIYSWDDEEPYLFLNLTGNHDVGYSGDATYQHMARFSEIFGKDNYWIEYDTDTDHPWRIVVLDDMLLEGPALQPEFITYTWEFLYQLFERQFNGSTVLMTHVPFYKKEGLCYDGPEFRYYPENYEREPYKANLLRSQNHLSEDVSRRVLNLIFDNDKPGVILTGHDHEGCETFYNKIDRNGTWVADNKVLENSIHQIKEVTVRSMMGEFYGNAGLLTGHFNEGKLQWEWHFTLCPFTLQHAWWFAKVSLLVTGFAWSLLLVL